MLTFGLTSECAGRLGSADTYCSAIKCAELSGDDLEEVLEHILRFRSLKQGASLFNSGQGACYGGTYASYFSSERIGANSQTFSHLAASLRFVHVVFVVPFKCEMVNIMAKVVSVAIIAEVWYKFIDVSGVRLE